MINKLPTKVNQDPQVARLELVTDQPRHTGVTQPVTCLANIAKAAGVTVAGGAAGYALGHAIH
jgi:hypothetical protein